MPSSWVQAIPSILKNVQHCDPSSILDIGVGFGKYGVLYREVLELPYMRYHKKQWKVIIHGIEVFQSYHNPIYDFAYDQIFYGNVKNLIGNMLKYDVITLIDVLEHFEKEEGKLLVDELLKHCAKALIISTPLVPAPQEEYLGNSFEVHKSSWSREDFKAYSLHYEEVPVDTNAAEIFVFYK